MGWSQDQQVTPSIPYADISYVSWSNVIGTLNQVQPQLGQTEVGIPLQSAFLISIILFLLLYQMVKILSTMF
jgi:hypothetical protein